MIFGRNFEKANLELKMSDLLTCFKVSHKNVLLKNCSISTKFSEDTIIIVNLK